jgi:hypothetical protein
VPVGGNMITEPELVLKLFFGNDGGFGVHGFSSGNTLSTINNTIFMPEIQVPVKESQQNVNIF